MYYVITSGDTQCVWPFSESHGMLMSMGYSRASEMMSQARMRINTTMKLLEEHSLIECSSPNGKRMPFGVQGCLRRMEIIELVYRFAFNVSVALKEVDCT